MVRSHFGSAQVMSLVSSFARNFDVLTLQALHMFQKLHQGPRPDVVTSNDLISACENMRDGPKAPRCAAYVLEVAAQRLPAYRGRLQRGISAGEKGQSP